MTQQERQSRYSHPMVARYDQRANASQLELDQHRKRELAKMRREIKRLLEELEAADLTPGQVAAKRLRYDILDKERDRLEGKPYTKAEPPKQSIGVINRALDQVNSIFAQIDATSTKALTSSERSNGVALFQPDAEPARSTSSERLDAVEIAVREALAADDIDLIYGNILLSQTQKQQAAAEYQRRPREVS